MGNREDLLDGAKECLVHRGWANTTVRDIAAYAGVSHAAIGYHFGSRERLLVQALLEELDELDDRLAPEGEPVTRIERWQAVIESFTTDKPLCAEDCGGLCPECGTNLNKGQCDCTPRWEDPRLAALKSLLPRAKEN